MGVVYMLVYQTLFYIGSTIQDLRRRINDHNSHYKRWLNKKQSYCSSFEIIKNNNYEVIEIEAIEIETEEECREREQFWIEFYGKNNLINNKNANGLDIERIKLNKNEDYKDNKNIYLERRKEYYENNKQRRKEYNEKNKEKIAKYNKEYYEKNKK